MRIGPDGRRIWTGELPACEKSYTGTKWLDGTLLGFLWSDRADLDPDTGSVRRFRFGK